MKYVFRKKTFARIAAFVDFFGGLVFHRREQAPPEAGTFLIVRLDHLGDILPATGIPQALKGHHPSSRVIFLTSTAGKTLLENNPYVDEVMVYDAPWFRRPGGSARAKTGFWELAARLREKKIDLGLSLRGDARENLLLFLAGVRFCIGYGITGLGFLLHRELSYREDAPETQHTLDVLRAAGIRREALLPALYFSAAEDARLSQLAVEDAGKVVIGVQFDAGSSAKTWPEAQRSSFLTASQNGFSNARFCFLGTDLQMAAWVDKKNQGLPAANLIGKTDLRELLLRIKACRYFIGPDSGPTHLAAALGVTTLFLYSGTNRFEKWRPQGEGADVFRNPVPCSPCHRTVCNVEGHPCMSGIQPEKVLLWLRERLRAA